MIRIIFIDDEKLLKDPCKGCAVKDCDLYGMEQACKPYWVFRTQQSLIAQSKPASWLDNAVWDWLCTFLGRGVIEQLKIDIKTTKRTPSQFIQEQGK
jgi:hypothetical protein